jgi:hypothetical protein
MLKSGRSAGDSGYHSHASSVPIGIKWYQLVKVLVVEFSTDNIPSDLVQIQWQRLYILIIKPHGCQWTLRGKWILFLDEYFGYL